MKKLALHWKIIIGMVLGVVYGLVAVKFQWVDFTDSWIKPWGTIFINLLKLIAVPLILASLIKGISSLSDVSKLSRIGGKTIGIYLMTTLIAVTFGLILVNVVQPGKSFSEEKRIELKEQYASNAALKIQSAESVKAEGPLQFLVDIVPNNFIQAAGNNRNMLQVIFFALLFGIAMVMLPKEKTSTVKSFFDGVNDIILQIVDLIMLAAPYGVFALIAGLVVDFGGSAELFKALGIYSITVVIGLLLMIMLIYPLVLRLFTQINYFDFFKGIAPAQMLAFSTSSSAATLPVTMERCEDHLGVSEEVSSFVLPLGATINMDGTSLYQSVAAVFIAQAFGYDLDLGQQMTIVLTATLASIGSAAVPGAGMVMLVIVLSSIGIDPEGIALIFAVDRILDMLRTVVNVTGDATVATVVAATEGQLKKVTDKELMS
ncbi:MAG: dicarboxylate/amino acid:cation symporter [Flavobacteriales bacterium]|nr:dicarboxylate/amino acid:cation symporter [Flavobacteriales bacterium]MBL6873249.1 dicarboxylate/amino acid:cation symporter [Flavobacteriales bacterium]